MIFYPSFYEACKALDAKDRVQTYEAIIEYGCAGIEPKKDSLSPIANAIFIMAKPLIDAAAQKRENGKKGGRPKKTNKFLDYPQSDTNYDSVAEAIMQKEAK